MSNVETRGVSPGGDDDEADGDIGANGGDAGNNSSSVTLPHVTAEDLAA